MKEEHKKFMRMAISLSHKNIESADGGPFGAVIVKEGKIIAKSSNKVIASTDPTAHAEVSAIRLACKKLNTYNLSGCTIYTSCEPCPMCLGAIYWARIDSIFYANTKKDAADIGFDDHFIYDEIFLPMEKRKLPFEQILRDEAIQAFSIWHKSGARIGY